MNLTSEQKQSRRVWTSFHEAGHAVIAHRLQLLIDYVELDDDGCPGRLKMADKQNCEAVQLIALAYGGTEGSFYSGKDQFDEYAAIRDNCEAMKLASEACLNFHEPRDALLESGRLLANVILREREVALRAVAKELCASGRLSGVRIDVIMRDNP